MQLTYEGTLCRYFIYSSNKWNNEFFLLSFDRIYFGTDLIFTINHYYRENSKNSKKKYKKTFSNIIIQGDLRKYIKSH